MTHDPNIEAIVAEISPGASDEMTPRSRREAARLIAQARAETIAELTRCTEFWKARVAERDAKVEDIARRNAALEAELALVTAERNEALSALEELVPLRRLKAALELEEGRGFDWNRKTGCGCTIIEERCDFCEAGPTLARLRAALDGAK